MNVIHLEALLETKIKDGSRYAVKAIRDSKVPPYEVFSTPWAGDMSADMLTRAGCYGVSWPNCVNTCLNIHNPVHN